MMVDERPEAWMTEALCLGVTANFFPERGATTAPAKQVCAACPVREECLEFALTQAIPHGIWGGCSERERRRMRVERNRQLRAIEGSGS